MNTMYSLVRASVDALDVGQAVTIGTPDNIKYFRKYLSEISKREGKKFTTKIMGDSMHILRVKYSNIYSKEVE